VLKFAYTGGWSTQTVRSSRYHSLLHLPWKMIFSLYIVNKSGGVIFKQDSEHGRAHDDANDGIRMGSLFHAFDSMAENFSPVSQPGQMASMETDFFLLKCLYTDSGAFTRFEGHWRLKTRNLC
jgi:hypothetical protein